uniref:vegetative cell wall protein gp1 n=1 Tax=Erigeron canadensis TaxID=72917 RepID=UPI001CB98FFC|nr:vegetative cell wall protein gp1 [Erigeron canadensis]
MNHTWFSKMSPWVSFVVLVLCFSFSVVSDARHRKQLPSPAVLVGTVYCDTCFHQEASKSTHFIPGATVAVECGGSTQKPSFHKEVKTNAKGEFKAKLPLSVSKDINKIKGCSMRLIRSGSPYCAVAATAASSEIHFKSKHRGTHIFSAGFFTFKPELCNQKDSTPKDFPPALPDPPAPFLPPVGGGGGLLPPLPVPDLPIPPVVPPLIPPLPRLPGGPLLPPINNKKSSKNDKLSDKKIFGFPFPPNPLQPPMLPPLPLVPSPPSLIPPLPFQPPPPALLPPLIPSPPPASVFPPLFPPFPTIPGLTPSPPPPPPPAFPIPLPPIPLIPGLPPVPPSRKTTP